MYYDNKGYIPILKAVHRAFVSMVGRRGTREPTPNPAFLTQPDHKTTHIPPHMTAPLKNPTYYLLDSGQIPRGPDLAGRHAEFRVYAEDYHVWMYIATSDRRRWKNNRK